MDKFLESLNYEAQIAFELRRLYECHGYKKVKVSKFEEYGLYIDNKNFLKTENIITFMDLDGKLLALRPDVTLSIVKNLDAKRTASFEKLYYSEKVYRLDKHNHAYKEISQMGLECLGSIDDCAMIEVLGLAAGSLLAVGERCVLTVSHIGFLSGMFEALELCNETRLAVAQSIKQKNSFELQQILQDVNLPEAEYQKILQIPRLYGNFSEVLAQAQALVLNKTMQNALDELSILFTAFEGTKLEKHLSLDFSVVNDLDYYNGIIFQGYIEGIPKAVLAGGRYDNLLRKFGKDKGAVGFAMYLDELEHYFNQEQEEDADLLVLYDIIDDYKAFAALIDERIALGQRVRTERAVPTGFRCKEVTRYSEGKLVREATKC